MVDLSSSLCNKLPEGICLSTRRLALTIENDAIAALQGGTNSSVVVDGEQQIPLANALGEPRLIRNSMEIQAESESPILGVMFQN